MVKLSPLKQVRRIADEEYKLAKITDDYSTARIIASVFAENGHRYRIFDTVIPHTDIPEYRVYISKARDRGFPNTWSRKIYKCRECGAEMTYNKRRKKIIFECLECQRSKKVPLSQFP